MSLETGDLAVFTDEVLGVDGEQTLAALLVSRSHAEHERVRRPRRLLGASLRRTRHDLELVDAGRTLTVRGAEAVGSGVAAADDDNLLALSGDGGSVEVAQLHTVGDRQELHRLMDAVQFAARDRQIASCGGAAGQNHCVELLAQLVRGDVHADIDVGLEDGAFGFHLLETAVDVPLLHLELGDAVAQQAADAVCPLEDRHCVTGAGQLLRCSQTGRATADNCDLLVGGVRGANRLDPPFVEGLVDDLDLDLLDGDRILVDAQDTGRLTGCGAQTTGELREVVGRVQTLDGVVPCGPCKPGRSTRESSFREGNRCGRKEFRSPCNGWPGS